MLTAIRTRIASRLRREDGFTLIELLVTMVAGIVVVSALYTILDVTLQTTTRTFTKVDATERARSTLATMEDQLHSACLTNGVTPIEGGGNGTQVSDANDLVFVSQFGTSASLTPIEHKITYSATANTLTEYTYALTGGSAPSNWAFSATPSPASGKKLLTNVTAIPSTPVFQYYAYEPYTDVNGNNAMMLMDGSAPVPGTSALPNPDPLASPLTAATADDAAEVVINLRVGGAGGFNENTNLSDSYDPVTDSVVLRFTPPPNASGANATFGPCA